MQDKRRPTLVLLGGTGFIGRHFIPVAQSSGFKLRALTRSDGSQQDLCGVEWLRGDVSDSAVWARLLVPGCVVVNLAHAQKAANADSVAITRMMVDACMRAGVTRLVHCSSISVYGRSSVGTTDERARCEPVDDYGRQKLAVEKALFDVNTEVMEITVLRPAEVFGPGGAALRTLSTELAHGFRLKNYIRSSLFGHRHMHLVPVTKVVSALHFLCTVEKAVHGEIFNVADDTEPLNNFRDVEFLLMQALRVPAYRFPRLPLPSWILRLALYAKGRGEIDPSCYYSSEKLAAFGFEYNTDFESELRAFIAYCSTTLK